MTQPLSGWRVGFARLIRALEPAIAIPAALLVVAEIVVLLLGIIARYVFHAPIVWTDELAGILFLWLAMLGSVIAFQRGEHMRMTAIVGMLAPGTRAFLDVVAIAASLAFLLLVIHPAYDFAVDEVYIRTPALDIVIDTIVSFGSESRTMSGCGPSCAIRRNAARPASHDGAIQPSNLRTAGVRRTRTVTSVTTPSVPSEPMKRRSGLGPAPEPGSRRDAIVPVGVTTRSDSTKSSMCV